MSAVPTLLYVKIKADSFPVSTQTWTNTREQDLEVLVIEMYSVSFSQDGNSRIGSLYPVMMPDTNHRSGEPTGTTQY